MLKVLVVEDEELIRKGIVLALDWAALDCVVVAEASNGEEALEAVERYDPSLIITDLKMPRMDGLEMLRCLRERGSDAYVIRTPVSRSVLYSAVQIVDVRKHPAFHRHSFHAVLHQPSLGLHIAVKFLVLTQSVVPRIYFITVPPPT